jgi:hypothetical protein
MNTMKLRRGFQHILPCFAVIVLFGLSRVMAQSSPGGNIFTIDASKPVAMPDTGYLEMGSRDAGLSPGHSTLSVNSRYLMIDRKPWLPVMGEFHFSRFPQQYWEEEILKMKAGGIQIISTRTQRTGFDSGTILRKPSLRLWVTGTLISCMDQKGLQDSLRSASRGLAIGYETLPGQPFIKVFGDYYDQVFSTHTTSRHPLGPIYCVDVTSDERRIFLGIMNDRDTLAPKNVEAFLDTLVKSVEIMR